MIILPFLFFIKSIIGYPCIDNVSYQTFPLCPAEQNTPDCYYLEENLEDICNSVFSRNPINGIGCSIFFNPCSYYNSSVITPNLFCCEFVYNPAVGAIGIPVNEGDDNGAYVVLNPVTCPVVILPVIFAATKLETELLNPII